MGVCKSGLTVAVAFCDKGVLSALALAVGLNTLAELELEQELEQELEPESGEIGATLSSLGILHAHDHVNSRPRQ